MNQETKNCQNCKTDFVIEPNDSGFYEKMHVPAPTFCPDCRRQRRNSWRNTFSLYSRKCDSCQKSVVSLYSPAVLAGRQDSGITNYCNKCWWSDNWDPKSFGVDYDFSRPFFTQMRELVGRVPHMSVVNDDGIASLNCEYTHDWWFSKNCYMAFSGWRVENVMYSFFILAGRDIMDCMNIRSKSEWLYECMITSLSYQVKYSRFNTACIDSQFLLYCKNCQDCFMCINLVGKKYFFKNKQYSKEEYEKILESYKLDTYSGVEKAKEEFERFILSFPRKHLDLWYSLNCTGDLVSHSKNVKNSFVLKKSENCRYCEFGADDKECYDLTMTGEAQECYESVVADHSQHNFFGLFSVKSQDIYYCQHCHNCKYCFGCVGLRNASYCIFNKQYTKEEYEELLPKIIAHMNEMPYRDKQENIYKYGEYYPTELSPFGYNETIAQEFVPLDKEDAQVKGYNWQDNMQRTTGKETLLPENIPDSINDITESILNEVLCCINCQRNYKIVPNEFIFYQKMKIPIPRKCFNCRHADRVKKRNPFKLWHRTCMCDKDHTNHEGKCAEEFETSYSPDRPEIVYCEKCWQQEVY